MISSVLKKFHPRFRAAALVAASVAAALLLLPGGDAAPTDATPTGLAAIHVPPGFKVEKVAGAGLVNYPMMGTFDDRGRLLLCESSGNTLTTDQMALLWVLNLSDGGHSLLDIAERAEVPFATISGAADALVAAELLETVPFRCRRAGPYEGERAIRGHENELG